jgi:hypothetical protein
MPTELLTRPDGGAPAFGELRARIQADIFAGLPAHFQRMGLAPDQLRDWQRDRLRRLLAAAIRHSAFHASRLRGIDPARFELADLPSLPVMTKTQMMDHFDEVISGRLLTRHAAERALAATRTEPRPLIFLGRRRTRRAARPLRPWPSRRARGPVPAGGTWRAGA